MYGVNKLIKKKRRERRLDQMGIDLQMSRAYTQSVVKEMMDLAQVLYQYAKGDSWTMTTELGKVGGGIWVGEKDNGWELAVETLKKKFGPNAIQKFAEMEKEEAEKRERLLRDKQKGNVTDGVKKDVPDSRPDNGGETTGATEPVRDGDTG